MKYASFWKLAHIIFGIYHTVWLWAYLYHKMKLWKQGWVIQTHQDPYQVLLLITLIRYCSGPCHSVTSFATLDYKVSNNFTELQLAKQIYRYKTTQNPIIYYKAYACKIIIPKLTVYRNKNISNTHLHSTIYNACKNLPTLYKLCNYKITNTKIRIKIKQFNLSKASFGTFVMFHEASAYT